MKECRLSAMPLDEAAIRIGTDRGRQILDKHLDPLDYQCEFYHLWLDGGYVQELQNIGNLDDMTAIGHSDEDVRKFALRELADLVNDSRRKPARSISARR